MCEDALNGDPTAKERCEKHWLRDVKRIMQRRKKKAPKSCNITMEVC